mmetsp:Transcript_51001/g.84678  ORF Transcript_51001/g.84678 Transcript_51001/m.84678 type:complete len:269 (+) Transcript_51001:40-846(+)
MDNKDDGLTIQYLRSRVTTLEADKKNLEQQISDYKHIETKLESIWNVIFSSNPRPNTASQQTSNGTTDGNGNGTVAKEVLDVDKLHEEYNKILSKISNLEHTVFAYKNRESELMLKLSEAQKKAHKHQHQMALLREQLKSHDLRAKTQQFVDPVINHNFNLMLNNMNELKEKLKASQDENLANGFNLQSQTGRSLIEKCKNLIIENQILGRQIQMNKNSNLTQKIILLHQHNLKLSEHIVKLNLMYGQNGGKKLPKPENKNNVKKEQS